MTAALLGFLGGIVAVGLMGWVHLRVEARREALAVRSALRLLADDAAEGEAYARAALAVGTWIDWGPEREDAWAHGRALLAARLADAEWQHLAALRGRLETGEPDEGADERGERHHGEHERDLDRDHAAKLPPGHAAPE